MNRFKNIEKENIILRVIFDLLLLIITVFMPWWVSFGIALISSIVFQNFFEIIFIGLWIDLVQFIDSTHSISFLFLILSTLMYLNAEKVRRLINFSY